MKTLSIFTSLLIGGLCLFTSCDDDRDSNPIIQQPDTFVLDEPTFSGVTVDLKTSDVLPFTYVQPNYGYTAIVNYQAQVSLSGTFTVSADEADAAAEAGNETLTADYATVEGSTTQPKLEVSAEALARQLVRIGQWTEDAMPATQEIYVRMMASVNNSYICYSNPVKFTVNPYYIELSDAPIEMWYLIGSCIGDGKWGDTGSIVGQSLYPMSTVSGYNYDKNTGKGELTFTGYFTPDGFKLVRVPGEWNDQWGQGSSFGEFVKNDGGSGNITVPTAGYYTLTLDTKSDKLTMTAADITPTVYEAMNIAGDFNSWAETQTMNAVNITTSMAGHNHIWSYTIDATGGDTTCKFLQPGWSPNWGSNTFPYGIGVNNGDNIPVTAGKWIVTFNDIDGSYAFTATE
ncbi:SusF/SusE family outer membrane protein [uncultured Bacteroides sp.]|uniref:SusE domain-containing protein n=1 Tax=uncultured Bacteroides sp. TaxID=162156 RepID=UPI002639B491|nr:SusF/SusE family outer membrane protein [uncultured Bacteroides sp.]